MPETCVVTIAHGRHTHLAHQLRLLALSDPTSRHVVVAMADEHIPGVVSEHRGVRDVGVVTIGVPADGLPLAAARNLGVARAITGGAEVVVLLDVDCIAGPSTLAHYGRAALSHPSSLLCGPVTYLPEGVTPPGHPEQLLPLRRPHPARPAPEDGEVEEGDEHDLFWSLSAALTPATWALVGGFCEEYVGYGGEDTDFAWLARSRGVAMAWVGGADAYHQHHPVSSPPVEHVAAIVRNAHVFRRRWGAWPMRGWLTAFAEQGLVSFDGDRLHMNPA